MPLLPDHPDDVHAVAGERVELHPGEAEGAVAEQQHDLALGLGELRRQRVAGARAETAERARVEPAARLVAVHDAARVGDEVPAVADHDRVAVEHLVELGVEPHRVKRRPFVLAARPARRPAASFSSSRSPRDPALARPSALLAGCGGRSPKRRADRAVALRGHRPGMAALGFGDVDAPRSRCPRRRPRRSQPEVHRHPDHERHVGLLQRPSSARARRTARGRPARSRAPAR